MSGQTRDAVYLKNALAGQSRPRARRALYITRLQHSSGAEASDLHAARKLPDTLSGGSFKRVKIYRGCLTEGAV